MAYMTRDELRQIGEKMYPGRWQTQLGRDLGISVRQMRRYAAGETPVPEPVAKLLRILESQHKEK